VGGSLYGKDNPVSEETLVDLYRKMRSGRSWSDAVASYWEKIKKEDKILLAQYNPKLSPEEIKRYGALAKFRNKII
jgi:predicted CopG family antitoxin